MAVDLRKIIAKRTYLVPIKTSRLLKRVFKQLNAGGTWELLRKGARFASFNIDLETQYAFLKLMRKGKERNVINITEKKYEFKKKPFDHINETLQMLLNHVPAEISYLVTEERTDGCIIQTTCKPVLYNKIVREIKYEQPDLQDIRLRGEEFLDDVFIGGLRGKEVQKVKDIVRSELLINELHIREIQERVNEMLGSATSCVLLTGWVGTEILPKIRELKNAGVTIRAVTHKPKEAKFSGVAEVRKGYRELISIIGSENVSVNDSLHGRALIVDNKALIGSMDLNSHSLSGEHIEFAIYTEDVDIVRSIRAYFEKMFKPLKK